MSLPQSLIAASIGALMIATAAVAQDAPPAHPDHPMGQHGAMMREHMAHRHAEHIQLLHDALAIRPDQEAAFKTFAESMKPEHPMGERGEKMADEAHALSTPERLDRRMARMAERQAAFQRHAAAVKAFYATLSPTQQKTFDALSRMGHHHMMGHDRGFGHGDGQGRPGPRAGE